jgi:hypothetical protein
VAGNELAHPSGHAVAHADGHGAGHDEPVLAPDQLKPMPFQKLGRVAAVVVAIVLVLIAFIGNHRGNVEKVFLVAIAAIMVFMLVVDFFLKRVGLRS